MANNEGVVTNETEAQKKEKARQAFGDTYETAIKLRDFERNWGEYENQASGSFGLKISQITDRCRNLAEQAIKKVDEIKPQFISEIEKELKETKERLIAFEAKNQLNLVTLKDKLDALDNALRKNDLMEIFRLAVGLESYYVGFMEANELLLMKADKASGHQNSTR